VLRIITRPLEIKEYEKIIKLMLNGFEYEIDAKKGYLDQITKRH